MNDNSTAEIEAAIAVERQMGGGLEEKTTANRRWMMLALLVMVSSGLFVALIVTMKGSSASIDGEGIPGSWFSVYENQVYVLIPGSGYFILPDADAATFEKLGEGAQGHPLGKDKNAVYCGNVAIERLDPSRLVYANDGYVSDGTNSWFCSSEKDNPHEPLWRYVFASDDSRDPGKLKAHYNELVSMPEANGRELKAFQGDYAVDDRHIFYEGRLLAGSDARSAAIVAFADERESDHYLKDANRVYYDGEVLAGANPHAFEIIRPDHAQWQDEYGYDRSSGRYYAHQHAFPDRVGGVDASGLELLMADRNYANHEWFSNPHSIFYWDYKRDQLGLACASPFVGARVDILAPGVFSDGHDVFVTEAFDIWGQQSRRGFPGLISRNTRMRRLSGVDVAGMRRVDELRNAKDSRSGWLWQAGDRWFFQPRVGQFHSWGAALYPVDDPDAFRRYVREQENVAFDRDAPRGRRVSSDIVCNSESRYRRNYGKWIMLALAGLGLAGMIGGRFSKGKTRPSAISGTGRMPTVR
ncbi:MAG: DKNYY domain-containing protein [Xanthomonadaceae bacterium]|nr:DKNYY domain-containing protein [Xanthomonadaceae bacterium]